MSFFLFLSETFAEADKDESVAQPIDKSRIWLAEELRKG
jgi:hypothetical protein